MRDAGALGGRSYFSKSLQWTYQLREADVNPSRIEISFQAFRLTCCVVGGNLKVCTDDGIPVVKSGPARDE